MIFNFSEEFIGRLDIPFKEITKVSDGTLGEVSFVKTILTFKKEEPVYEYDLIVSSPEPLVIKDLPFSKTVVEEDGGRKCYSVEAAEQFIGLDKIERFKKMEEFFVEFILSSPRWDE